MSSRNPYSIANRRPPQSSLFDDYHAPPSSSSTSNGSILPQPNNYRPATPNSRGQYAHSVLESLESQNDTSATSLLSSKVSQLKQLTIAIGDEIRDSSTLADSMNNTFEGTSVRLKGTMRRMLRMAERTGVGWRVWLGFLAAVVVLFVWVWLF